MARYARSLAIIFIICLSLSAQTSHANEPSFNEKVHSFLQTLTAELRYQNTHHAQRKQQIAQLDKAHIRIENCQQYPYHNNNISIDTPENHPNNKKGAARLIKDIKRGLHTGLQCLSGQGPMGKLHSYHEEQALRLIKVLESDKTKTFRCVKDKTFAYAIAKSPPSNTQNKEDYSDDITKGVSFPGVVIDTYRIGGYLSDRFNADTYRNFFKLNDEQVQEITTGKPVHLKSIHRYKKLNSLMFHEMIHWLGHEHSSIHPDVTELYDHCCFGGSDHITDIQLNKKFQTQACNILKDKELWEANAYKKMQLWHYKEYDQFKRTVRNSYD